MQHLFNLSKMLRIRIKINKIKVNKYNCYEIFTFIIIKKYLIEFKHF